MTSNLDKQTLHQMQMIVNKLKDNSSYMAWVISVFQKQERITGHKLIELINTNEEDLVRLSLCKRPNTNSAEFAKQLKQIAEYANIDMIFLANMIRQVESVESISEKLKATDQRSQEAWQPGLAAARDKTDDADKSDSKDRNDDDMAQQQ